MATKTVLNEEDTTWAPPERAVDDNGATHDSIQSAVDNADDFLMIGPGSFDENVTVDKAVTIKGAGPGTTIDGGTTGPALTIDADGVKVEGLAIRNTPGSGAGNALLVKGGHEDPEVEGVWVWDSDSAAISTEATGTIISSCRVISSGSHAFEFTSSATGGSITNCVTKPGVGTDGIRIGGSHVTATANVIEAPNNNGIIVVASSSEATVSANVVVGGNVVANGVKVDGDSTTLIGNSVTGARTFDFHVPEATNLTAYGNTPEIESHPSSIADSLTVKGWVDRLVENPNATVETDSLTNGSVLREPVLVEGGETIEVYRWGAYQVTDGTAPSGLDVELLDDSDTVVESATTPDTASTDPTDPIAWFQNPNTGAPEVYKLRVANNTGGDIASPGVAGAFSYRTTDRPIIIEDFESDNPLSEWENDTASFDVDGSFATHWNNGLSLTGNNASARIENYSGLIAYPEQGDEIKYDWTFTEADSIHWLAIGVDASNNNHYRIDMDGKDEQIEVWDRQVDTSTYDRFIREDFKPAETGIYTTTIQWDDGSTFGGSAGDFTVFVENKNTGEEVVRGTGNDTTRTTSGGVFIYHETAPHDGETVSSDYYRITNR